MKRKQWLIAPLSILLLLSSLSFASQSYKIGQQVEAQWRSYWYPATIKAISSQGYQIHYDHAKSHQNIWVKQDKLRPKPRKANTNAPTLGDIVFAKWHGQWFPALIKKAAKKRYQVHYLGYSAYWDEWLTRDQIQVLSPVKNQTKPNPQAKAMIAAAAEGDINKIQTLLKRGIDINISNNLGETALLVAVKNQHLHLSIFLIDHGAKINHQDNFGQTALLWAANRWNWDLTRYLLDHGANPNLGPSPLFYAIQTGKTQIVKLMLDKGAQINKPFPAGITPLQLAKNFNHPNIVSLLEKAGAK